LPILLQGVRVSGGLSTQWQVYDERGRRKYLNIDERRRFLAAADRQPVDLRALCYVLAYTGCRISEALALTPERLDRQAGKLLFQTLKRRKLCFRAVPVPLEVVRMLASLPARSGDRYWPMHRVTAWRHIKRLHITAHVSGPMACCKGLRHGFGIRAAARSVPPNLIQRWMGHASQNTTSIYLDAVGVEEQAFAKRMW
jgi:integrase/recombinase XerD